MKKIMFNDKYGLTQAVLEGRKTQTRRIIPRKFFCLMWDKDDDTLVCEDSEYGFVDVRKTRFAQYKAGDMVAVAQNYKDVNAYYSAAYLRQHSIHGMTINELDCVPNEDIKKWFKIRDEFKDKASWNNKMFVKPEYMPHQIHISNVHIERLQEISDDDCLKEGLEWDGVAHKYYVNYDKTNGSKIYFKTSPKESYAELIDKVSGKGTWESNPYVFVYEFNLIK